MTGIETHAANAAQHTRSDDDRIAAAIAARLAKWLYLASTPTFAMMALLTTGLSGESMPMLCSNGFGALLGGMFPMYLLMSVFHSPPWLRLIVGRWVAVRRHDTGRPHDHPLEADEARTDP